MTTDHEQATPAAHAPSDSLPAAEPAPAHVQIPLNPRSVSLAVLALIASVFALHLASVVFIPLLLGVMVSYALSPLVDGMQGLHVPRALGAALLLCGLGAGAGWTAYALSDDAAALIASLPEATQKLQRAVRAQRGQSESAIDKVQRAASDLERAAQESGAPRPALSRGVTRVSVERAHFDLTDYLWSGTLGAVATAGQALVVLFIAYFLMVSGNSFRRKVVRIAGPSFARRRITVEVLDEITQQVRRYLLMQVLVSVLVGVTTGLAFAAVGLEHAAVWGIVACVLNFVPYIGSVVIVAASSLVAFVQFGSFAMALQVGAIASAIHLVSGNLLTPWLTSRTNRLNAVCVFVGLLAFGWLWGVWGLLLGVPLLTTAKAVCDRVDGLQGVGELLGR